MKFIEKYFFVDKWCALLFLVWLAVMGGCAWWTMEHSEGSAYELRR